MITRIDIDRDTHCGVGDVCQYFDHVKFYGISTDTKPTNDVPNAAIFYVMDAQQANVPAVWMFDAENGVWLEQ